MGGRLAVFPSYVPSLAELGRFLEEEEVTLVWLTAGLFQQMVDEQIEHLGGVRQLLTGGDVVSAHHVRVAARELPECAIINGYGPTENTVFTTCHRIQGDPGEQSSFPIGKPISNSTAMVLNEEWEPVPIGVEGELYAGGVGLARGYFGRPEATAEKFVPNPYGKAGERMYRTGDRVSWKKEGWLEFLGRQDQQVKVRGYRIELEEIGAVLAEVGGVKQALAMVREDTKGDKRLVGYVAGEGAEEGQLLEHLRRRLPEYMVPGAIVVLDEFPLTENGKVDRRGLPAPEYGEKRGEEERGKTPIEEMVMGIWREVLKVERMGVEESFFELGGHSLLATQVMSRVRKAFGIELPLRVLFEGPTIREMAEQVEQGLGRGEKREAPAMVAISREQRLPLSFAQQRLWFIDQLEPGSSVYNVPFAVRCDGRGGEAARDFADEFSRGGRRRGAADQPV
jgi:acyl carrier protein